MRGWLFVLAMAIAVSGCASSAQPQATSTPAPKATRSSKPAVKPTPNPTYLVGKPYAAFASKICGAFKSGNAGTIIAELPYYQYNSGLRYGHMGDGLGQTGDPSLMHTWLSGAHVKCRYFTPGIQGHGVILTSGWNHSGWTMGGWSLVEADLYSGKWKINDFTFGAQQRLYQALHTAGPILPYHA
ncbi:MAG: hypothetical protein ACRDFS_12295 [Chloroflexota bacterium]